MTPHNTPLPELLEMVDRYFDCLMTDEEESRFRSILAATKCSHPAIDEAKAVMGFRKPRGDTRPHDLLHPRRWRPIASVAAASVAVMLGIIFLARDRSFHSMGNSTCVAYVNGAVVTDETEVLKQLTADMREFGDCVEEAHLSLREEFDDAAPIIENFESASFTYEH